MIAVQRQTAASRSTRPLIRGQHGVFGGWPMVTLRRLPNTSAHTPSLSASIGHLPLDGLGLGFGGVQEATRLKKRMFRVRKRTTEVLEAIRTIVV